MKLGELEIFPLSDGIFRLDGGLLFGSVPKVLWQKKHPADESNRILLGVRSLLVKKPSKNILIDTGMGNKIDDKIRKIYALQQDTNLLKSLEEVGLKPEDIDVVIHTHLHFDHCGWNTRYNSHSELRPTFPNARHIVQQGELDEALNPGELGRYSYFPDDYKLLLDFGRIATVEGDGEVECGVSVMVTKGHTEFHQSVKIESEGEIAFFAGDFIPTASHIKPQYIAGLDLFPMATYENKKKLLPQALEEQWLIIFCHAPSIIMGYLYKEKEEIKLKAVDKPDKRKG
jgi:glyoxylase-like metal-dependent hydrolase (beta-lactamase superfamily II)